MYCRAFQFCFRAVLPILPYKMPTVLNKVSEIPAVLAENGFSKVLIVSDKMLKRIGAIDPLLSALEAGGIAYTLYADTVANPTIANVEAARTLYIENGCEAIIAFGGGSSMDCAKGVAARIARPNKSLKKMKGILRVLKKTPVLIAVATTAGTGSETTLACVIIDESTRHKYVINDFVLIPKYAVLDSSLTKTLPQFVTATTGMDALTHAVEAYIGRSTTSETRADALGAVKLIFENIDRAYSENKAEARANMLKASHMAGRAFSKSYVGYVHAVAHTLGGEYNIAHGYANAVLLPVLLEEYGSVIDDKLYQLALSAGVAGKDDSHASAAIKFIKAIRAMQERFLIPHTFAEIKEADVPALAKKADAEANPLYPVPILMNAVQLEKIYYKVMEYNG